MGVFSEMTFHNIKDSWKTADDNITGEGFLAVNDLGGSGLGETNRSMVITLVTTGRLINSTYFLFSADPFESTLQGNLKKGP